MSHGRVPGVDAIVLVGFMASGKTTVGAALARRLDWDFVDFDTEVRKRWGRTPGEIIREDGEAAFRELEGRLTEQLADRREVVMATGGGWVTRPDAPDRLGPDAVRVWLRVSAETAVRRAASDGAVDRPLLGDDEDRLARARSLLEERAPLYGRAELAVDVDTKSPDEVAEEILRRLGSETGEA